MADIECERCKGSGIDPQRIGHDPDWCSYCGGVGSWNNCCERCGQEPDAHDYEQCVETMVSGMRADYDFGGHDLNVEKYLRSELATALRALDAAAEKEGR